jgi:hypothetical protein
VGKGGFQLEVDGLVGLVEVLAALTVADEDVGAADGGEHGGRCLAGVGTLIEPVHGLGADVDLRGVGGLKDRGERGHRGTEDDVCVVMCGYEGKEGIGEGYGFGGGLVHLPVGGNEWLTHVSISIPFTLVPWEGGCDLGSVSAEKRAGISGSCIYCWKVALVQEAKVMSDVTCGNEGKGVNRNGAAAGDTGAVPGVKGKVAEER